jgi:hypothetical protein
MTGFVRAAVLILAFSEVAHAAAGDAAALSLRAAVIGVASDAPLTITLFRWPTEAERAPLLSSLSAPPPAPAPLASSAGGRAGRGGRGVPPAPPSPLARLTAAVKAAPTCGFIWTNGVTGYSIKYAWQASAADGAERIVLITDRRLGTSAANWAPLPGAAADSDFTLIEMRIDGKGTGEGKASLGTNVVVDTLAGTLALDGYASAPALLRITR